MESSLGFKMNAFGEMISTEAEQQDATAALTELDKGKPNCSTHQFCSQFHHKVSLVCLVCDLRSAVAKNRRAMWGNRSLPEDLRKVPVSNSDQLVLPETGRILSRWLESVAAVGVARVPAKRNAHRENHQRGRVCEARVHGHPFEWPDCSGAHAANIGLSGWDHTGERAGASCHTSSAGQQRHGRSGSGHRCEHFVCRTVQVSPKHFTVDHIFSPGNSTEKMEINGDWVVLPRFFHVYKIFPIKLNFSCLASPDHSQLACAQKWPLWLNHFRLRSV